MIVYISGPITGIPDNNREAFCAAETKLHDRLKNSENYEIINPQKIAKEVEKTLAVPKWEDYMRACIKELCRADTIIFLPGYENSKGAMLEKEIAEKLCIQQLQG